MEVFITAGKQLSIVLLILVSLPLACKLLWWLRLLPLAVYFVATKLPWRCILSLPNSFSLHGRQTTESCV